MPVFVIEATKVLKDGTTDKITVHAPSSNKAQWKAAQYKADGYTVVINQQEKK